MKELIKTMEQVRQLTHALTVMIGAADAATDSKERLALRIECAKLIGKLEEAMKREEKLVDLLNMHTIDKSCTWDKKEEERRERHDV